jgi:chromosome segregation ATPase
MVVVMYQKKFLQSSFVTALLLSTNCFLTPAVKGETPPISNEEAGSKAVARPAPQQPPAANSDAELFDQLNQLVAEWVNVKVKLAQFDNLHEADGFEVVSVDTDFEVVSQQKQDQKPSVILCSLEEHYNQIVNEVAGIQAKRDKIEADIGKAKVRKKEFNELFAAFNANFQEYLNKLAEVRAQAEREDPDANAILDADPESLAAEIKKYINT